MPIFTPSPYQTAIFDWIEFGHGNAFVEAVAGSGKTTTIVNGAQRIPRTLRERLFLAFNRSIVAELKSRLGNTAECLTLNGLGHRALARRFKRDGKPLILKGDKYRQIVRDTVDGFGLKGKEGPGEIYRAAEKLVGFAQAALSGTSDEALCDVADHYGVEFPDGCAPEDFLAVVRSAMKQGVALGKEGVISFDDQIWLPLVWNLPIPQYDFVMVDEAQDLSKAKTELALRAVKPSGRSLFVGDRYQSIYGFAGADARSVANIIERTKAKVLPLSVSYRCPKAVIERAKTIVPHIEWAPNAADGLVETISSKELLAMARPGDAIICRLTAPLVKQAIEFMRRGTPVTVKGRDIAGGLIKVANTVGRTCLWDDFLSALELYSERRIEEIYQLKDAEKKLQAHEDTVEALVALHDGLQARSLDDFTAQIDRLFSDGDDATKIVLLTAHRAKGLEWRNVFIIAPDKMPMSWKGQQDWELEQERNLHYVAITRAQEALRYVTAA